MLVPNKTCLQVEILRASGGSVIHLSCNGPMAMTGGPGDRKPSIRPTSRQWDLQNNMSVSVVIVWESSPRLLASRLLAFPSHTASWRWWHTDGETTKLANFQSARLTGKLWVVAAYPYRLKLFPLDRQLFLQVVQNTFAIPTMLSIIDELLDHKGKNLSSVLRTESKAFSLGSKDAKPGQ